MEMTVRFPGNLRVEGTFGAFTLTTDQPPSAGGEGSAPTPFATFLASLGTCAGVYVLGFCRQRGLDPRGIRLEQVTEPDPATGLVGRVTIRIHVPEDFPEKYRDALVRAANQCTVKKHLEHPPAFDVTTVVGG